MISVYQKTVKTLGVAEDCILAPPEFFPLLTSVHVQSRVPPIMPRLPHLVLYTTLKGTDTPTHILTLGPYPSCAPAAPPPSGTPAKPICIDVANTTTNLIIQKDTEGRTFSIRTLFSDTVRPKKTTGKEICCAYQCWGHCFSDCHRKATCCILWPAYLATLHTFVKGYHCSTGCGFFLQRPHRPLSTFVSLRERAWRDVMSMTTWRALIVCHTLVRTWRALIARHSLVRTNRALISRQSLAWHHTHRVVYYFTKLNFVLPLWKILVIEHCEISWRRPPPSTTKTPTLTTWS